MPPEHGVWVSLLHTEGLVESQWREVTRMFDQAGADGFELNFSHFHYLLLSQGRCSLGCVSPFSASFSGGFSARRPPRCSAHAGAGGCRNMLSSAPPTTNVEMVARCFEAGWGGAVLKTLAHPGGDHFDGLLVAAHRGAAP